MRVLQIDENFNGSDSPIRSGGEVLLVDDDESVLQVTALALTRMGHSVTTCRAGGEALERLNSKTFDLLLIDCNLSGISGLEVARRWREQEPSSRRMGIVVMSGELLEVQPDGVDGMVAKPISLDTLARTVDRFLTRAGLEEST